MLVHLFNIQKVIWFIM